MFHIMTFFALKNLNSFQIHYLSMMFFSEQYFPVMFAVYPFPNVMFEQIFHDHFVIFTFLSVNSIIFRNSYEDFQSFPFLLSLYRYPDDRLLDSDCDDSDDDDFSSTTLISFVSKGTLKGITTINSSLNISAVRINCSNADKRCNWNFAKQFFIRFETKISKKNQKLKPNQSISEKQLTFPTILDMPIYFKAEPHAPSSVSETKSGLSTKRISPYKSNEQFA
ncbi:hypothetical protein DERP_007296 [Dermatophagoides pteronyssinus]|uniref:Uncharacterized protein n=1 Tax=Dermatophagoides pteronyssinus TaxID=6956 RepID=A0ABQ8J403_DERPT|nr:hypothetical protein DERP_007296 [Dermatophagoides pteronyssinus]